ncbi:hypothetical protein SAMN05192555_108153 [Franzmannia pantelleriensis]|uniref:Uncharacterized protein n=1 Tax=Franzmannia pantelleriensis TaxID=48727 RepID=A0A1G9PML2_9GAMM|nr:hypothetical protein [Halomonas pantelleriensis]SDL99939.1 hypothetical protein SAMN05192555_108153 [Halomonas pantelleriensis]
MDNKRTLGIALLGSVLTLPVTATALADEVVEQIELGLERYQEEDYGGAIAELEFAISDIRSLVSGRIAETFPEPPSGWSAEQAQSAGGGGAAALLGGGGAIVERQYRQEGGDGQMEATLMVDNPMVQGMAAMFNNPALIAAQPELERERMGRETAIVKWEADRARAEVSLLLDSRILLQVNGQNLDAPDVAIELLRDWDLDAVREQAAR